MGTVWFVPGFGGSELWRDAALTRSYWPDPVSLALLGPGPMRLDHAGTGPGSPDGLPLYPGRPLELVYGLTLKVLAGQLGRHGLRLRPWGWDFRKDILAAGQALAAQISASATVDDPAVLVGHSAGGLVCRAAWSALFSEDKQQLVRRIVTLGTPHWGTYQAVSFWTGIEATIDQLRNFWIQVGGGMGSSALSLAGTYTLNQIISVGITWPGLYQLLPLLGAPDQVDDPQRQEIYNSFNWQGSDHAPRQDLLNAVRTTRDPWLRSAASQPPDWVMTVVSATGWLTPSRLVDYQRLGFREALGSPDPGDGIVTKSSAEDGFQVKVESLAGHNDLPRALAVDGTLLDLILDPRGPLSPVPPVEVDDTPVSVQVGAPPFGILGNPLTSMTSCIPGRCSC